MKRISPLRIGLLRFGYLLLVVGLGLTIWPGILHHVRPWTLMQGVERCMLGALSALSVLGLFRPLKMLPLLYFELVWKVIWLTVVALPLWSNNQLDGDTLETAYECLGVVIFPLIIPWDHVIASWRRQPKAAAALI